MPRAFCDTGNKIISVARVRLIDPLMEPFYLGNEGRGVRFAAVGGAGYLGSRTPWHVKERTGVILGIPALDLV